MSEKELLDLLGTDETKFIKKVTKTEILSLLKSSLETNTKFKNSFEEIKKDHSETIKKLENVIKSKNIEIDGLKGRLKKLLGTTGKLKEILGYFRIGIVILLVAFIIACFV